jgi:hypothetical protein
VVLSGDKGGALGFVLGGVFREGMVSGICFGQTFCCPGIPGFNFNVQVSVSYAADVDPVLEEGSGFWFLVHIFLSMDKPAARSMSPITNRIL